MINRSCRWNTYIRLKCLPIRGLIRSLFIFLQVYWFLLKSIWLELKNRKQVNLPDFISFRKNEDTHEKDTLNYISESFTVFFTSVKSDMIPLPSLTPFQENNMPWFPKKKSHLQKLLLHKNILQIHVTHISYQHISTVLGSEFGAKQKWQRMSTAFVEISWGTVEVIPMYFVITASFASKTIFCFFVATLMHQFNCCLEIFERFEDGWI